MPERTIESYLETLKTALAGSDKALIQDALWDAENHLRSEMARDENANLEHILAAYGEPTEVAAAYRERDALVTAALAPLPPTSHSTRTSDESEPAPHPSYFGVLKSPRAYTSMLYLLLSLATGIFFFTWTVTGLSLSLGLLILIIGIPFLIAFLASIRLLALAEGRLIDVMLGVRMPRRQPPSATQRGWMARLKAVFTDGHTWTSICYLLLKLPLGIFQFTVMVTMLSLSLSLLATPIIHFVFHEVTVDGWAWGIAHLNLLAIVFGVLGIFTVPLTFHVALLLGRMQGLLAKHLLVRI